MLSKAKFAFKKDFSFYVRPLLKCFEKIFVFILLYEINYT